MRLSICPKCGAKVAPSDNVCLDCGVSLAEAAEKVRQEMRDQSMAGRTGQWQAPNTTAVGPGAGQGRPGETAEAVRLRVFDKQAVKGLTHEMITSFIIALGALVAGADLLSLGSAQLKTAGGLGGFELAALRTLGGIVKTRACAAEHVPIIKIECIAVGRNHPGRSRRNCLGANGNRFHRMGRNPINDLLRLGQARGKHEQRDQDYPRCAAIEE